MRKKEFEDLLWLDGASNCDGLSFNERSESGDDGLGDGIDFDFAGVDDGEERRNEFHDERRVVSLG